MIDYLPKMLDRMDYAMKCALLNLVVLMAQKSRRMEYFHISASFIACIQFCVIVAISF